MTIRLATTDDASLLAALNRHVHEIHVVAEPRRYRPTVLAEITAWFTARLEGESHQFLIAEHGGRPAPLTDLLRRRRGLFRVAWAALARLRRARQIER